MTKSIPGPGYLAAGLIVLIIIGSSFGEQATMVVFGLLLIILLILMLEGYGQLHNVISGILSGQPTAWGSSSTNG